MTTTHVAATVPLPPPVARPQDAPLRRDVRWLAATLGRVVGRLAGADTFRAVEDLRRACRARRLGVSGAPVLDALLARTRSLPPETARLTARAFTVFFILINAAEQAHRVRRSRQDDLAAAQRGSVRWALHRLREGGHGAEEVARTLASLDVRPVLTAHRTESARRTILDLQARLAEGLLARDAAPEPQRRAIEGRLEGEVELLWLTEEVRRDRPSVVDEVANALWYLEDRLLDAASRARERLVQAFEDEFGSGPSLASVTPLTLGSWVGGDRDGNPFVTAEITLAAARSARRAVLGHYAKALAELASRLSVSERLAPLTPELRASLEHDRATLPAVWEQNRRRNADEPLRLKVSFMRARVEIDPPGYAASAELEHDLTLVADALDAAGAAHASRTLVEPLLAQVRAHGFHGYRLDVREDAGVHTRALDELTATVGLGRLDGEAMRRELAGRRPLHAPHVALGVGAVPRSGGGGARVRRRWGFVDAVPRPWRHRGPRRGFLGRAGAHRASPGFGARGNQDHRAGRDRLPELRSSVDRRAQPRADALRRPAASVRGLARRPPAGRGGPVPASHGSVGRGGP